MNFSISLAAYVFPIPEAELLMATRKYGDDFFTGSLYQVMNIGGSPHE
jgi:hypothetical protein